MSQGKQFLAAFFNHANRFDRRTGIASVGFVGFPSVGKVLLFILEPIPLSLKLWHLISVHSHVKTHWHAFGSVRDRFHYSYNYSWHTQSPWRPYTNSRSSWVYVNPWFLIYLLTSAFEAGIIEGANDGRGRGRQGKPYTCFTPYCYINDIQSSSHCRYDGLQLFTIKINSANTSTQSHEHVTSSSLFLMSSNLSATKK